MQEFLDALFQSPPIYGALVVAIIGGLAMWRQWGGRPWFAALAGFLMVVFGWFFLSFFNFSSYPAARQLLAILLLVLFGIGLVRIPGKALSVVGGIFIVISVLAFSGTPPFDEVNLSEILSGQVLDNAKQVLSSIFGEASTQAP